MQMPRQQFEPLEHISRLLPYFEQSRKRYQTRRVYDADELSIRSQIGQMPDRFRKEKAKTSKESWNNVKSTLNRGLVVRPQALTTARTHPDVRFKALIRNNMQSQRERTRRVEPLGTWEEG
jgi:hypothetical protein